MVRGFALFKETAGRILLCPTSVRACAWNFLFMNPLKKKKKKSQRRGMSGEEKKSLFPVLSCQELSFNCSCFLQWSTVCEDGKETLLSNWTCENPAKDCVWAGLASCIFSWKIIFLFLLMNGVISLSVGMVNRRGNTLSLNLRKEWPEYLPRGRERGPSLLPPFFPPTLFSITPFFLFASCLLFQYFFMWILINTFLPSPQFLFCHLLLCFFKIYFNF